MSASPIDQTLHALGLPHPLRALCPLYILDQRGWPLPIGTGVLLAIADARFVLTCAHVADLIPPGEALIVHTFINGSLTPLQGEGAITRLSEQGFQPCLRASRTIPTWR